jgi:sarcosine oxidase subunit gamma
MLERRSALAGYHGAAEQPGVDGIIDLVLGEVGGWSLVEIGVYPSQTVAADQALTNWIGVVPVRVATPIETHRGLLIRTGPLSYWLVGPGGREAARAARMALPETATSVIDLSSSRTRLAIAGPRAADVLLKGIPIDLASDAFAIGHVALTGVHHTPILLHRPTGDRFEVYAMRTFALTVFEWLTDAALEFGYRVRHHDAPPPGP